MKFIHASSFPLSAVVALIGIAIAGCGSASESPSQDGSGSTSASSSEYVDVLIGLRDAAMARTTYDAYGYAEYLPATQRAAIDAFCAIANLVKPETTDLEERSHMVKYIVRKAEVDLKAERDIVAPVPARKAIRKLLAVLDVDLLNYELAKPYVKACY